MSGQAHYSARNLGKVAAALASPFTIRARNEAEFARLVADGRLHPDDVRCLRIACRAGLPLYRGTDGRLGFDPRVRAAVSEGEQQR